MDPTLKGMGMHQDVSSDSVDKHYDLSIAQIGVLAINSLAASHDRRDRARREHRAHRVLDFAILFFVLLCAVSWIVL